MVNFVGDVWNWITGKQTDKAFFNPNQSLMMGRSGPVYLDTYTPYRYYNEIPELKQIIDKKSLMFANMEIKLINIVTGETVEDDQLQELIQSPNVLQGMNEWLRNYKTQEQVYGNQFMYKNQPSRLSKYPTTLQNISPSLIKPNLTGKYFDQVDMSGIVKNYEYTENGTVKFFDTSDVLWSRICDLDNPLIGTSPLKSLKYPLTNTKYAYDYRNVLLNEKGAIGILSAAPSKDAFGAVPMDAEVKKEINDAYADSYGIGSSIDGRDKMRIHITEAAMNWQPMTFPTKDLLLFEEVDANKLTMVDHFGMNINIFSSKNQTYENVKNAIIQCYQDTIIPEADQFTQSLGPFIGIPQGTRLVASYDHVAILKKDLQAEATSFATIVAAIGQAVTSGIINAAQANEIIKNKFGIQL